MLCNRILFTPNGLRVCQEKDYTEHDHDTAKTRAVKPGDVMAMDEFEGVFLLPTLNKFIDFVQTKAEEGNIRWDDDAPIFWGMLEELQAFVGD